MTSFLELNQDPIWNILIRFLITLLVLTIIIHFIYFRNTRKEGNVFAYFQMGIMMFLVCILLKTVDIQLGVTLGLFAIFAIIRFRSENLSLRDMAYFFTVIGVSVINAMATFYNPVRGPILINSIIIVALLLLENIYSRKALSKAVLVYD
jgi:uncharacterized membrane protein